MRDLGVIIGSIILIVGCSVTKPSITQDLKPIVFEAKKSTHTIPGTPVTFDMVLLPGGSFNMGSPEAIASEYPDEGPQVEVTVASFWIGEYELTYDEYNVFREKDLDLPSEQKPEWNADAIARPSPPYEDPTFGMGKKGFPAVSMTQFAALQYCKWLSEKTGTFYRLPSEAEWEYACKAGTQSTRYFEEGASTLIDHAWHYDNSMEKYHEVGSKEANPWGLYDMLGNVSEWTLDQYKKDAYAIISSTMPGTVNPWIKPTKLHPRTVRGGSWDDKADKQRCTCRIESSRKWKERDPQIPRSFWWNTDSPFVGFRLISPAIQPSAEEQAAFWELVLGG